MKDSAEEYVADVVDGFNPRRLDILDDMTGAVKVLGNMDVVLIILYMSSLLMQI